MNVKYRLIEHDLDLREEDSEFKKLYANRKTGPRSSMENTWRPQKTLVRLKRCHF
jgi:hypothetical protein